MRPRQQQRQPRTKHALPSPDLIILRYLIGYAQGEGDYAHAVASAAHILGVPKPQIRAWLVEAQRSLR